MVSRYFYFKERDKLENGYFYNTIEDLEEATALSRNQQPKAINKLCKLNLIDCRIKGIPAKRYFKVYEDIKRLENVLETSINPQFTENKKTINPKSSKQDSEKSVTNNTKQKTKQEPKSIGSSTQNLKNSGLYTFDFTILERQIRSCYSKVNTPMSLDNVIYVFKYFIDKHNNYCAFPHPKLSNQTIISILENITNIYMGATILFEDIDADNYENMIDFYWEQAVNQNFKGNERDTINYSIAHFMSEEIKKNCFYKTCY